MVAFPSQLMDWPPWTPNVVPRAFPPGSLLAGCEPALWLALGSLPRSYFAPGAAKQPCIRAALASIGLAWVATNTTPFRVAVGCFFDAAARIHQAEEEVPPSSKRRKHTREGPASLPAPGVHQTPLPELPDHSFRGTGLDGGRRDHGATADHRRALWRHLDQHGACVLRGAVDPRLILSQKLPEPSRAARAVKLASTAGNGMAGDPPSTYVDLPLSIEGTSRRSTAAETHWLIELEWRLWDALLGDGAPAPAQIDLDRSRPPRALPSRSCGNG